MDIWISELNHEAIEEGGLVLQVMFSLILHEWYVHVVYLGNKWHQAAFGEEGKNLGGRYFEIYQLGLVWLPNECEWE